MLYLKVKFLLKYLLQLHRLATIDALIALKNSAFKIAELEYDNLENEIKKLIEQKKKLGR